MHYMPGRANRIGGRIVLITLVTNAVILVGGCASHQAARPTASGSPATTAAPASHAHEPVAGMSPDAALKLLTAGNARFVAGSLEHPNASVAHRSELAKGQHPYAIVLSCSDSRVPPEIVFDAGLGDLFVIRVAGNTADDVAIGTIEYAVDHLGSTLIVVLGHERCGAVTAAVESANSTTPAPGHLPAVLDPILPAVKEVKGVKGVAGDTVDLAVRANVAHVVEQLKACGPLLKDRIAAGRLHVVGGRYDLDTGVVELK